MFIGMGLNQVFLAIDGILDHSCASTDVCCDFRLLQDEIEMLLDECLLNEEEMVIYNAKAPPQLVAVTWPPPLPGDGLVAAARNPIVRSV